MHGYSIPAAEALDFAQRLRRLAATANMLANIEAIADARRPLLTYAALVLEYIIRIASRRLSCSRPSASARACCTKCCRQSAAHAMD